jgi:hypothetical protein
MGKTKGMLWAGAGFGILVLSLVLASPRPGPGKTTREAARPVGAEVPEGAAPAIAGPLPAPAPALRRELVRIPYQEAGALHFQKGEPQTHLLFPVPPRTRLVIEQVSVRVGLAEDRRATAIVTVRVGEAYATHAVPLFPQGRYEGEGNVLAGTQPLRAYADGGTSVQARVDRTGPADGDSGFVSITGYLEELR